MARARDGKEKRAPLGGSGSGQTSFVVVRLPRADTAQIPVDGSNRRFVRQACSVNAEETMRYLGMDVHGKATVFCLLDADGKTVETGSVRTTAPALSDLAQRLSKNDTLVAAQEVGTMCQFVHDVFTAAGVKILSFNAQQLRVIASSRKKTDKRDSFWIAKCLQTDMMPHPVYIPDGDIRKLRSQLAIRANLTGERKRWLLRARSQLRAVGIVVPKGVSKIERMLAECLNKPDGLDPYVVQTLELCSRMMKNIKNEITTLEAQIIADTKHVDDLKRLKTIPAIGDWVALYIYAWVGDVRRFRNARLLSSYAGLVPSVHQSGDTLHTGRITKAGSNGLRSILVQAGHVLLFKCKADESLPLKDLATRVHTARARRKIAVVAAGRFILRTAFYVLRDGTTYERTRLRRAKPQEVQRTD
ncbi:MAG TPA: IS110 family transposase [Polyangium sp.]|nr:IS110 family transposase [Polyangium sp.]